MRSRLLGGTALALGAVLLCATTDAPLLPYGVLGPTVGARLPGFAADLAQRPAIVGGAGWAPLADALAWDRLITADTSQRQAARWDYARSLIGAERGPEAIGVLEAMRQDDPDLGMVDAWRLAHGAALTLLGRSDAALAELDMPGLATNPEACLWRMRALAGAGTEMAEPALQQMACAVPALDKSRPAPFALAIAGASLAAGQPEATLRWLSGLPDRDPAANVLRGRAEVALGRPDAARLRFGRVEQSGTPVQRMDARLSMLESDIARKAIAPGSALRELNEVRFSWRGDAIEERALRLAYGIAVEQNNLTQTLSAGAALVRYHDAAVKDPSLLTGLRTRLSAAIDPARNLPLDQAAGLYWDYRDIAPTGAEGDLMASRLAERLQQAGLYERAADLLSYQLTQRAGDLARGPLSARVAGLYILAGKADRALRTLRETNDPGLPDDMMAERKRVEAAALAQLGRTDEAMAALDELPGSGALQGEILWQRHEWARYADIAAPALPTGRALDPVAQAQVLRYAISQAMLGNGDGLTRLHARYAPAFKGLASAPVFEMLTGTPGAVDPGKLAQAMAAIPSASPAGDFADLLMAGKKDPATPK
ncbi:hypothetical protein [Novosphingobium colocasiae]|uniref:Tetratricopeptide repeat protein n=1 Tax=Novosphingobium colocasiae TaxID=1256513 RepID=A0A918UF55_9SPHN|nr:hypothetical protein [Novosphingobium colocasiae]GGZ00247.1 hypothetical protein GCM10011614_14100 [Novosphingobium colocasiae]